MDDTYAIFACVIIALLFLGAITYYVLLFSLVRNLKAHDSSLWGHYRDKTRTLEPGLSTAYKIVMRKRHGGLKVSDELIKLIKVTKINLYATMALFMLVLFIGLYFSVNKP